MQMKNTNKNQVKRYLYSNHWKIFGDNVKIMLQKSNKKMYFVKNKITIQKYYQVGTSLENNEFPKITDFLTEEKVGSKLFSFRKTC